MADTHFTGDLTASLLGVPLEIRLRIFKYVFVCSKIVITLGPRYNADPVWPVKKDVAPYRKAITQVSSVLRQEALALLCSSTTLRLRVRTLWNKDEIYLDNLLRKLLGRHFLEGVRKLFICHCLLDSVPIEKLPALRRVGLWWKILTDDEKLLGDLDASDPSLHQMILEKVTRDVSEGRIGNALNAFRRKLIQQSRRIQCVWAVFFKPRSCCERGQVSSYAPPFTSLTLTP